MEGNVTSGGDSSSSSSSPGGKSQLSSSQVGQQHVSHGSPVSSSGRLNNFSGDHLANSAYGNIPTNEGSLMSSSSSPVTGQTQPAGPVSVSQPQQTSYNNGQSSATGTGSHSDSGNAVPNNDGTVSPSSNNSGMASNSMMLMHGNPSGSSSFPSNNSEMAASASSGPPSNAPTGLSQHYQQQLQQPPPAECLNNNNSSNTRPDSTGGAGYGCSSPSATGGMSGSNSTEDAAASAVGQSNGVQSNGVQSNGVQSNGIQSNGIQSGGPVSSLDVVVGTSGLTSVIEPGWTALPDTPPVEIKLFVGRVPRTADENILRPVFAEYGMVTEIAIIKDRNTSMHKGSAFVRMASITQADAAVRGLNNVKVLDPQLGALQVRYATGEAEKLGMTPESAYPGQDQAKLFVGSLPRNVTEEEVRNIFGRYGQLDEVFIMRDSATGQGKGCAFVKFAYKEQAIHAIKTISGVTQLSGAPRPLEVRFAESKKTMGASPAQQQPTPYAATAGVVVGGTTLQQQPIMSSAGGNGLVAAGVNPMNSSSNSVVVPRAGTLPGSAQPNGQMMAGSATAAGQQYLAAPQNLAAANNNPRTAGPWKEYFTDDGRAYYHNQEANATQWERPAEFDRQDIAGPPGANIFVFHVPNDWTQQDLINNFHHFGQIVSARIATDKATGRNKGYAFVSFTSIQSAAQAVQHMNGFMAGTKRLKVSIKQNEEIYVQHLLNGPPAPLMNPGPAILGAPGGPGAAAMGGSYRGMMPAGYATAGSHPTDSMAAAQAMSSQLYGSAPQGTSAGQAMNRYGAAAGGPTAGNTGLHSTSSHRYAPY